MAITLGVGPSTGTNSGTVSSWTLTLNGVTAGRSLVVGLVWNDTSISLTSVACTGESNLTLHTVHTGTSRRQFASLANVTASGNKTLTFTFNSAHSNAACDGFVFEVVGADTGSFFDKQATATGSGTSQSVSITPTNDNALLAALVVAPTTISPGSGYTAISIPSTTKEAEYKLDAGSIGAKTVDFSSSGSGAWEILAAAFNALPPGSEGTSEFDLPLFSVEADSGETIGTANNQVPIFTVFAEDGTHFDLPLFTTSAAGLTGETGETGASTLPIFTTEAAGTPGESAVFDLPLFTVEAVGLGAVPATLDYGALPLFEVAATGTGEMSGTAEFELPLFTVEATDGAGASFDLPLFELSAAGQGGAVGAGEVELPLFSTTAAGDVVNIITAEFSLPLFTVEATALPSSTGAAELSLRMFTLEASGETGTVATAAIALPLFVPAAAGSTPSFGTASVSLPLFYTESIGTPTFASTWRTWVLNLHTRALTEYTGFQFNSYARFDGHVLGASDGGIFKLDASTSDAGTSIAAVVRTGVNDYDSSWLKRVPRLYVNYSTTGDVEVRTITSEDGRRRYLLPHNNVTGIQQRRVPVGAGPKSRWWQFEIVNRDGADFSLSNVLVYPSELRRRSK